MARFDEIKTYMLYRIYQEAYEPRAAVGYSAPDAERFAPPDVPQHIAIKAIEALIEDKFLEGTVGQFAISARGLQLVELQLEDPDSEIAQLAERLRQPSSTRVGTSGTAGVLDPIGGRETPLVARMAGPGAFQADAFQTENPINWDVSRLLGAPASDRTVALDHNGGPYKEAVTLLERCIREFKDDHHLDNELGREKNALVQTLEVGRELLDDAQVRISSVVTTVVNPLKVLIARYQDAIAHGIAIVAVEKLCELALAALSAIKTLFS